MFGEIISFEDLRSDDDSPVDWGRVSRQPSSGLYESYTMHPAVIHIPQVDDTIISFEDVRSDDDSPVD